VADQDFIDVIGRDARALERGARRDRAELGRVDVAQRAAVSADRRPGGAHDEDLCRGHIRPSISHEIHSKNRIYDSNELDPVQGSIYIMAGARDEFMGIRGQVP
jgi:hypothetical protein